MTRNELIQAFDDNVDDELRDATFAASLLLKSSDSFDFKVGGAVEAQKDFNIYRMREKKLLESNKDLPLGLSSTVKSLKKCGKSILTGGYARAPDGLIYFWTNSSNNVVGCIVMKNDS